MSTTRFFRFISKYKFSKPIKQYYGRSKRALYRDGARSAVVAGKFSCLCHLLRLTMFYNRYLRIDIDIAVLRSVINYAI